MKTRLKELRIGRGLTQQQLADEIKCTRQAYSRYELGEREPDYETLIMFANFYNVTTDYILGLSDKKNDITPERLDNLGYDLTALENLSDNDIETIKNTLHVLISNLKKKGEKKIGFNEKM